MDSATIARLTVATGAQFGLITLEQLREIGVTRRHVTLLVRDGWLHRMAPGVYGLAGAPPSIEKRLMLGLLSLGSAAVVSHEAAARLHGFDRCLPDAVEFTVPRGRRNAAVPGRIHSTSVLPPIDRVRVGGFPCTSATRTIIDLARARISTVRLETAVDSAVRTGASSPIVLARRLEELRGPERWGVRAIDALLPDTGGHTLLERRFLRLMREAGLPRPTTQVVHRRGSRTVARVDFHFDDDGIVVEVSGRRGHASDAERARDAQRRNELQDMGRRVYEYTFHHVFREPAMVVRTMRDRLRHDPAHPVRATS